MLQRTSPGLRASDLDSHFGEIYQQVYGHDDFEDNPYLLELEDGTVERRGWKEAGVTAAMALRFAEFYNIAAHELWGNTKIASFTPVDASTSVCFYIRGHHVFFVDDPQTMGAIAKMSSIRPKMRPSVVLKVLTKDADPPASKWLEWTGEAKPGH